MAYATLFKNTGAYGATIGNGAAITVGNSGTDGDIGFSALSTGASNTITTSNDATRKAIGTYSINYFQAPSAVQNWAGFSWTTPATALSGWIALNFDNNPTVAGSTSFYRFFTDTAYAVLGFQLALTQTTFKLTAVEQGGSSATSASGLSADTEYMIRWDYDSATNTFTATVYLAGTTTVVTTVSLTTTLGLTFRSHRQGIGTTNSGIGNLYMQSEFGTGGTVSRPDVGTSTVLWKNYGEYGNTAGNGANVTASDNGNGENAFTVVTPGVGNTITYDNTAGRHGEGNYSIKYVQAAANQAFCGIVLAAQQPHLYGCMVVNWDLDPTVASSTVLFRAFSDSGYTTVAWAMVITQTTHRLQVAEGSGASVTGTATLNMDTQYVILWEHDTVLGKFNVSIYTVGSNTLVDSFTVTETQKAPVQSFRQGINTTSSGLGALWIEHEIGTAYVARRDAIFTTYRISLNDQIGITDDGDGYQSNTYNFTVADTVAIIDNNASFLNAAKTWSTTWSVAQKSVQTWATSWAIDAFPYINKTWASTWAIAGYGRKTWQTAWGIKASSTKTWQTTWNVLGQAVVIATGSVADAMIAYYTSKGYTGSLDDMRRLDLLKILDQTDPQYAVTDGLERVMYLHQGYSDSLSLSEMRSASSASYRGSGEG